MSLSDAIAENEGRNYMQWEDKSRLEKNTIFDAFRDYIEQKGKQLNFNPNDDFIYKISEKYHFIHCHERFYILDYLMTNQFGGFDRRKVEGFIKHLLEKINLFYHEKNFNYALFDCPPSFTLLSNSALSCCNLILIPVNPDFYSVNGVVKMLDIIGALKSYRILNVSNKIAIFMNKAKIRSRSMTWETQQYWKLIKKRGH